MLEGYKKWQKRKHKIRIIMNLEQNTKNIGAQKYDSLLHKYKKLIHKLKNKLGNFFEFTAPLKKYM